MPRNPKTKKPKTPKGKKRSSAKVPENVKQYVDKKMDADIEDKCVQANNSFSFGNVFESTDFNAYPMAPLTGYWGISQGVGQGGRIGNMVKTKKVYLNYIIRPTNYDATFNPAPVPCEVQLLLGYVRNTPNTLPVAADINNIFQSGSSVSAPIGTLRDIISVINKDYWVIKKRWIHKVGFADNSGTGGQAGAQYYTNNDFKLNAVKSLDITKHLPATLKFNDSAAQNLTKNLFFMIYCVAANGAAFGSTILPMNIEYWVDYHFEDA